MRKRRRGGGDEGEAKRGERVGGRERGGEGEEKGGGERKLEGGKEGRSGLRGR